MYDVAIFGAGINGAAAARQIAGAGYTVLLVDSNDLASGATGRSSRILHCGLRYFETAHPVRDFALNPAAFGRALRMARASMQARSELVRQIPHRLLPYQMSFPLYRDGQIRPWHLRAAMAMLGAMGPREPALSYRLHRGNQMAALPFKRYLGRADALHAIASYQEYQFDWPERIAVDAALEAELMGADLQLFCTVRLEGRTPDGLWQIALAPHDGSPRSVAVRIVLNLAGSWVDEATPGDPPNAPLVRGSKGTNIAVRLPEELRSHGLATLNSFGMPFYCLPSHDDYFFIGPTETPFEGDARDVHATDGEIAMLLDETRQLLPGLGLQRKDIAFSWAGVRPLTNDPLRNTALRDRRIHNLARRGLPGIHAMTGGPVMTHLSAGREMLAIVRRYLGPAAVSGRSNEQNPPLTSIREEPTVPALKRAVEVAVAREHACDLSGILYTRTGLGWRRHLSRQEVEEVSQWAGALLDWSDSQCSQEVQKFMDRQRTVFRNGEIVEPVSMTA